jgi:hypothetical protein
MVPEGARDSAFAAPDLYRSLHAAKEVAVARLPQPVTKRKVVEVEAIAARRVVVLVPDAVVGRQT